MSANTNLPKVARFVEKWFNVITNKHLYLIPKESYYFPMSQAILMKHFYRYNILNILLPDNKITPVN